MVELGIFNGNIILRAPLLIFFVAFLVDKLSFFVVFELQKSVRIICQSITECYFVVLGRRVGFCRRSELLADFQNLSKTLLTLCPMRNSKILNKKSCSNIDIYRDLVFVAVTTIFTIAFPDSAHNSFRRIEQSKPIIDQPALP